MKEITSTNGVKFFVSDEDYDRVINHGGWITVGRGTNTYLISTKWKHHDYLHRFILGLEKEDLYQVDHIDGNGLNNQRENLRLVSSRLNKYNFKPIKHSSKYRGVSFHKSTGKWRAYYKEHRKQIYIGLFDTEIEAARAYDKAIKKARQSFGNMNLETFD